MNGGNQRKALLWLFGFYCGVMLWLLFFRRVDGELIAWRYNLQPLDTVRRYLWVLRNSEDFVQRSNALANLLGNAALFLPFGLFLPLLFSKLRHFGYYFLLSLLTIVTAEILQTVTGLGTLDVDDLILNLIGSILGFLAWKLWQKRKVTAT